MNKLIIEKELRNRKIEDEALDFIINGINNNNKSYHENIKLMIYNEELYVHTDDYEKKYNYLGDVSDTKRYRFLSKYILMNSRAVKGSLNAINKSNDFLKNQYLKLSQADGYVWGNRYDGQDVVDYIAKSDEINSLSKFTFFLHTYIKLLKESELNEFELNYLETTTELLIENQMIDIIFSIAEEYIKNSELDSEQIYIKLKSINEENKSKAFKRIKKYIIENHDVLMNNGVSLFINIINSHMSS